MKDFKPTGKLTGKQQAMIAERIKDPKASNAEIIKRAGYKAKNTFTASQQYLENMKNPEIQSQLDGVVNEIETVLINTVRDYSTSDKLGHRTLATNTAMWIHDKVRGKATQKIETQSTSVNISIDLRKKADSSPQ
jgi:hypothetical protein